MQLVPRPVRCLFNLIQMIDAIRTNNKQNEINEIIINKFKCRMKK